jgi:chitinase
MDTAMKRLITFFLVALPLLLACEKPTQKIVIPIPDKPTGQQGGNSGGSGDNGGSGGSGNEGGNTDNTPAAPPSGTIIVGYAVYWESTLPDPKILTHINYAFGHIENDFETLKVEKEARLKLVVALKKQNPNLKVLLSVGGWEAGNFSEMAADEKHRKQFCKNCLTAVTKYMLDGIDIDWEYPTSSAAGISSSPEDTKNFTLLMKELRETLGKDRLLTMASASNAKYVDFKDAIQYMNFVNVMTYDMGDPPKHNGALYKSSMASESCDESVAKHFAAGVPYNKIVLGIPFYGHGDGKAFEDYVDYKDIAVDQTKYSIQWDATAMVPYVTDATGKMVLTYDNAKSVGLKADYVRQKGLAGAMYWNIEADDASFTLGNAVASRLLEGYVPPTQDDPSAILVTNEYVQKYLEEVTYKGIKDETTKILGYPGGGPGEADIPPTHTIRWTANASAGALDLIVWEGDWSRTYNLAAGTSSQDLSNLVPGREYHYKVTSSADGKTVAQGFFKTKGLLHQVYFEPRGRNARDLGGWKGLDGKTLAFRKIFRGGAIHGSRTNSAGKAEMRAQGIKAEVDLREEDDVPSKSPLGDDIAFFAPGFDSGYNTMIRDNPDKVKETFCFVVQCLRENKPVYFHCAAGRDRTGTLAVLIEGALGVSESDMAKDYELTYFSPEDWSMYNGSYQHIINTYSFQSIYKTIFEKTDSGTYQERIVKYLLQIGVPQKDIDDLRSIMLE